MLVAKQAADLITFTRASFAVFLSWLGLAKGAEGLPSAVWIMIADWTGDAIDGRLARRSRVQYHTWIGDHDLEVDMLVALGLLVYLMASGFVSPWVSAVYLLAWVAYFWRMGLFHSMGMLCQAPVYAWFIWIALRSEPHTGIWLVAYIVAMIAVTWPYFPKRVIPGFLYGMQAVISAHRFRGSRFKK